LVAYIVPRTDRQDQQEIETRENRQTGQVAHWRMIFDDHVYSQLKAASDPTFNTSGWNSNYTGLPIPAPEMREWLDDTVQTALSPQPKRVLEIGCGTGLLLFRLAPHCSRYIGLDFSRAALVYVQEQLDSLQSRYLNVQLMQGEADSFEGIPPESLDL